MALKNIWKITLLLFPGKMSVWSKAEWMKEFLKQSRKENGSGFREVGIRSETKITPNQKICLSSETVVLVTSS
jgi:hypothetical protein